LVLPVRLTVSDALPEVSKRVLVAEAESIWRDAIQLDWRRGGSEPGVGANLPVLVMSRIVVSTHDRHQWTVGELFRY